MNFKGGFYLLCIFCGILFQDCSCTEDEIIPYVPFDQEFLDYTDYKKGSYWIYTELSAGKEDSCYVSQYRKVTLLGSSLPSREVNADELHMKIVMRDTIWNGQSVVYNDNGVYRYSYYLSDSISNTTNEIFDAVPLTKNASPIFHRSFSSIEYLPSLSIQGITYQNVKVFTCASKAYFKRIYWAKQIGIIKKDMKDGTQWELVRSNISQ